MKYTVTEITRIQEGASLEDIENGDAYETAYIITDERGEVIYDTTDHKIAKQYMTEEETSIDKHETEITKIATDYGSLEILTAYLMRSRKMSYEKAADTVCNLDEYLDHMFDEIEEHEAEEEEEYVPSSTNSDYSPSNPWNAPGMNVSDFI